MGEKNTRIMEEDNGVNGGDRSQEAGDRIIQSLPIFISSFNCILHIYEIHILINILFFYRDYY